MRFLPAFNINATEIYEAIRAGRIRLQPIKQRSLNSAAP